jgi:segregation and condensation protein A
LRRVARQAKGFLAEKWLLANRIALLPVGQQGQHGEAHLFAGAGPTNRLICRHVDDDYKVKLDIFEGPLDLLLYLIKKDEVDIYDISIERITREYMGYLDTFKMLNIDLAVEFVNMAANLMYIKSRTLLPKHVQPPEDDADEDDPRWELIRQLVEYKKFKDAAELLHSRASEQENYFSVSPELVEAPRKNEPVPFPDVGIFDLIRAFQKVLDRFHEDVGFYEIYDESFTVSDKIDFLLTRIPAGQSNRFSSLFEQASSRDEVIITFIALLELIKLHQFRVVQDHLLGEIELHRNENT